MAKGIGYRLEELFRRDRGKMVGYVSKNLADEPHRDAEDVVMEVISRLFEAADPAAPVERTASYVFAALRNRIVDLLRSRRGPSFPYDEDDPGLTALIESNDPFEREERYAALYAAIDRLRPDEKAIVVATEFEGRPFRELADEWDIPIGTLLSRKKRALDKIKKDLTTGGNDHVHA